MGSVAEDHHRGISRASAPSSIGIPSGSVSPGGNGAESRRLRQTGDTVNMRGQGRSTPYARSANNQLVHGFRSIESLRQAPCSQLSSMAHRLAVTRTRNVPLLQAISQVAQERLPGFKHTQLCQML